MKKLLALLLVLILGIGCLASCELPEFLQFWEQEEQPTDADKVAADKAALVIENLAVVGGSTAALPVAIADGEGCTITWAVATDDATKATVADATVTFASCTADTTVKVIATIALGEASDTKEFIFNVTANELSGEAKVAADKAALNIENLATVGGGKATLPVAVANGKGCTITWAVATNDAAKATLNGATLTFASCTADTTVKVIATITSGNASDTKEFTFNVTANELTDEAKVAADKAALNIENLAAVGAGIVTLPTAIVDGEGCTITWAVATDDAAKATIAESTITFASCTADTTVKVIATITSGDASDTKEFTFNVTANELTDEAKVAADKAALNIENLAAVGAGTATLPTAVADGEGCAITWAVATDDAAKATIADATITFASCKVNTTVKVIATITSGEASDTKEFTFNVTANEEGGYVYKEYEYEKREGTQTFDGKTEFAFDRTVQTLNATAATFFTYTAEEGRGDVLEFNSTSLNQGFKLRSDAVWDDSGYDAAEISFDINLNLGGTNNANGWKYLTFTVTPRSGKGTAKTIYYATNHATGGEHNYLWNAGTVIFDGKNGTSDIRGDGNWIHVRAVVYAENTSLYLYINDSTPIVIPDFLNDTAEYPDLENVTIKVLGQSAISEIKIDNLFGGFIVEDAPTIDNELTDEEKVAADKALLAIQNLAVAGGGTAALPTAVAGGKGCTIAWAVAAEDAAKATLNGATLTFASCAADTTVKVIATITSGEASDTKEFTFNVTANEQSGGEGGNDGGYEYEEYEYEKREGTQTFDGKTEFAFDRTVQTLNATAATFFTYTAEEGRGDVLEFNSTSLNQGFKLRSDAVWDDSGYDAAEISFDINLNLGGTNNANGWKYLTFTVTPRSGKGTAQTIYWATNHSAAGEFNRMWGPATVNFDGTNGTSAIKGDGNWIHVRAVVYAGDTSLYLYINGDAPIEIVNFLNDTAEYPDLENVTIKVLGQSATSEIKIDNLYGGFIVEDSPNPKD